MMTIMHIISIVRQQLAALLAVAALVLCAVSSNAQARAVHNSSEALFAQISDSLIYRIVLNDMEGVSTWSARMGDMTLDEDTRHVMDCIRAFVDLLDGRRRTANKVVDECIDYFATRNDTFATRALAVAYCTKGYFHYETDLDEADRYYKKAQRCSRIFNDVTLEQMCLFARGHLYYRAERYVEAAYCARQLLAFNKNGRISYLTFRAQLLLYRTYSSINADAAAEDYLIALENSGFHRLVPSAGISFYQAIAEDKYRDGDYSSALGYVDRALDIAADGNISDVHLWQLNLLKAISLVMLGETQAAKAPLDYCRKNVFLVDPRCSDGNYSRYHVYLIAAHCAILEGRYADAEQILALAPIPSVMLTRTAFVMHYNTILEQIYRTEGDYENARRMLMSANDMRKYTQAEHARMRTKDMEITYREDPTINSQRVSLVSERHAVSALEFQLYLGILVFVALCLIFLVVFIARLRRRRRQDRHHEAEYNKRLQHEVEVKTAANVEQNKLLMRRNADIQDSQAYARRLQHGILPDPSRIMDLGLSGGYVIRNSADTLEGCFYWFRRVGDSVVIVCADCVDSGVAGAMYSMVGLTVVNDVVMQNPHVSNAAELLHLIDDKQLSLLPDSVDAGGFEMSVAIINLAKKRVSLSSACQDVVVRNSDGINFVMPAVRLVGVKSSIADDDEDFESYEFDFKTGDEVFFFTAALTETIGSKDVEPLGLERLVAMFDSVSKMPVALRSDAMQSELQLWSGARRTDDFLLISIVL